MAHVDQPEDSSHQLHPSRHIAVYPPHPGRRSPSRSRRRDFADLPVVSDTSSTEATGGGKVLVVEGGEVGSSNSSEEESGTTRVGSGDGNDIGEEKNDDDGWERDVVIEKET